MLLRLRRLSPRCHRRRKILIASVCLFFITLLAVFRSPKQAYEEEDAAFALNNSCLRHRYLHEQTIWPISKFNLKQKNKILFIESNNKVSASFRLLMEMAKFRFEIERLSSRPPLRSLPRLTSGDLGRFAVIVFENVRELAALGEWQVRLLEEYCRSFGVWMIAFLPDGSAGTIKVSKSLRISPRIPSNVREMQVLYTPVTRILKPVSVKAEEITGESDVVTLHRSDNLSDEGCFGLTQVHDAFGPWNSSLLCPRQNFILIAGDLESWVNKLLLLDAISYVTSNRFSIPLEHYIRIDIDDIFVCPNATRLVPDDVRAMLATQRNLSNLISNFRFSLGITPFFFHSGSERHSLADDLFLRHKNEFEFFPHSYRHLKAHKMTKEEIGNDLRLLLNFTNAHGVRLDSHYAVSPHHSGVYPVFEPLYDAWRDLLDIRITSTYYYPHMYPKQARAGFQYRDIRVLPRTVVDLYTGTNFWSDLKKTGGKEAFRRSLTTGSLFVQAIAQPFTIWMSHHSNYGSDRLAPFAFLTLYNRIKCVTNLDLYWIKAERMADLYFDLNKAEIDPVWTNPCSDKHLKTIYSGKCDAFPNLIILGPQKTGSTALATFLNLHPQLQLSKRSEIHFEEIQFFNTDLYFRGLSYYLSHFERSKSHLEEFGEVGWVLFAVAVIFIHFNKFWWL